MKIGRQVYSEGNNAKLSVEILCLNNGNAVIEFAVNDQIFFHHLDGMLNALQDPLSDEHVGLAVLKTDLFKAIKIQCFYQELPWLFDSLALNKIISDSFCLEIKRGLFPDQYRVQLSDSPSILFAQTKSKSKDDLFPVLNDIVTTSQVNNTIVQTKPSQNGVSLSPSLSEDHLKKVF